MKTGRSLIDFIKEVDRQATAKQDVVAKTNALELSVEEDATREFEKLIKLNVRGGDFEAAYGLNEIAHDQLGSYLDIPAKYYDRCRNEDPDLLIKNVNAWISRKDEKRLIRTLDGNARAFLSDKYHALDNEQLAERVLPLLLDSGKFDIHSCEVTQRKLYIKVVGKELTRELAKHGAQLGSGHTIVHVLYPAITISNSEVGCGALSIQRGIFNGGCSNLATFGDTGMRRHHVGARHELVDEQLAGLLSAETHKKVDEAIWAQVRDIVQAGFDKDQFNALVDKCEGAAVQRIDKDADVIQVVKAAGTRLGLRDGEQKGILQSLIEGGDLSRFGLHNAVTAFSQSKDVTYDRASELEKIGAEVIEMPQAQWDVIAKAN